MGVSALFFLLLFFTGCVLAFARHPIFGLLTYVSVFYLNPPMRWWGQALPNLRWSMLAAVVTLLAVWFGKLEKPTIPFLRQRVMLGFVLFVLWIAIQSAWAMDPEMHQDLLSMYVKFIVVLYLMYRCLDSEEHLKYFLWAHLIGCFTLGWIATTSYTDGRFEGFDAPGIGEANAGALHLVTGVLVAGSLFIYGSIRQKVVVLVLVAIVVNGIVTTVSRSGFLAVCVGGIVFNLLAPQRFRKWVWVLSVVAVGAFLAVTNQNYWSRMSSIEHAGAEVEGLDTGAGRLEIIQAQWRMFANYPLGCGHRCTAVLSPNYIDDKFLANSGDARVRASHNSFMSLVVEQGIFGLLFYVSYVLWTLISIVKIARRYKGESGFVPMMVPGIAGSAVAIIVGDLFVDYLKFEMRIWIIGLTMVMLNLAAASRTATVKSETETSTAPSVPRPARPTV